MGYVARIADPPEEMPPWFSPHDDEDPPAYPLRMQWTETLIHVMVWLGALEEHERMTPFEPDAPATTAMFRSGRMIDPEQCELIARGMRTFADGVPDEVYEQLRKFWNDLQAQLKALIESRGEVAVSGFEEFPYDKQTLRMDLLHWGAFNAIAAQHGGYRLNSSEGSAVS